MSVAFGTGRAGVEQGMPETPVYVDLEVLFGEWPEYGTGYLSIEDAERLHAELGEALARLKGWKA